MVEQTRQNIGQFVWDSITSLEELAATRMESMNGFLDDYAAGRANGRYVRGELPALPFSNQSFDLALCSHFLFLYGEQFGGEFHRQAVLDMLRVASEVRIFPLLGLDARPSRHVDEVASAMRHQGYEASIEAVPYEFQRGGNQMIRIRPVKP